jgi:glycosyltransferase involved in cell wall biosynthesis
MRIIFFANKMPDPCGAFFHDYWLARVLQARGHTILFVTVASKFPRSGVYRGVPFVYYENAGKDLGAAHVWSSPHFPFLGTVRRLNEQYEKPLVVTMHFGEDRQSITNCNRSGNWGEFLWFVSKHISDKILENPIASSFKETRIVRPILIESELRLFTKPERPTGDCITLINANILKGLSIFVALAQKFPNRKFLGVKPYYNKINVPNLPNIEWMDIQDDIRVVLRKTRILLVPSLYESWGRVAFEAMYNGIPTLYTRPSVDNIQYPSGSTEGMRDWIQDNGIQCDRNTLDDWARGIQSLDNPSTYNDYSDRSYNCTADLNIFSEAGVIEQKFIEYAMKFPSPDKSKSGAPTAITQQTMRVGPNRFMGGGVQRRQPPPPVPVAPQAQGVRPTPPSQPRLGFHGGRFGAKK